jgi:hypothetical protein
MKFKSKKQMIQALLDGRCFKVNGEIIYYDESFANPFRHGLGSMVGMWQLYNEDIWEEIKPQHTPIIGGPFDLYQSNVVEEAKPHHVHQDLIDSYQAGQAWQLSVPHMDGVYTDCKTNGEWVKPDWYAHSTYRLHPHNKLIQAHRNGAKIQAYICGDWVEEPYPDWYEDTQYRVKPATKTVYEWMYKTKYKNNWIVESILLSEEEAKHYFNKHEYQKTSRSWEVEE